MAPASCYCVFHVLPAWATSPTSSTTAPADYAHNKQVAPPHSRLVSIDPRVVLMLHARLLRLDRHGINPWNVSHINYSSNTPMAQSNNSSPLLVYGTLLSSDCPSFLQFRRPPIGKAHTLHGGLPTIRTISSSEPHRTIVVDLSGVSPPECMHAPGTRRLLLNVALVPRTAHRQQHMSVIPWGLSRPSVSRFGDLPTTLTTQSLSWSFADCRAHFQGVQPPHMPGHGQRLRRLNNLLTFTRT